MKIEKQNHNYKMEINSSRSFLFLRVEERRIWWRVDGMLLEKEVGESIEIKASK